MQIDQKTLQHLLSLDDRKLSLLLQRVAQESGVSPDALGAQSGDIASIRAALGSATEEDLKRLNALFDAYRQNRGR